jgi:hypothetical protein
VRTRLTLTRYYLADGEPEKARAVATVDHIRPPLPTPRAQFLYESLRRAQSKALGTPSNRKEKTE